MSLATNYLGFRLAHPFMPGASPLVDDLDTVKRLEDAGASAIVMHSLFEEQIQGERLASIYHMEMFADSYQEATSYFPKHSEFRLGPDQYLEQVRRIKQCVAVPVIASLNGTTRSGWVEYASLIEQCGADALELNVYYLGTDPTETGEDVERRVVDLVSDVRKAVAIPLAVKLTPFFSSLANLAYQCEAAGADGLVLFNRFYQPDIDPETLEAVPKLRLSDSGSSELLLRLRWLAILSSQRQTSLALSGGVHTPEDAVKAVMAGADAVQLVSALLRHGPEYLATIREGVQRWMEDHEYVSLQQMKGSMNMSRCPDPQAFERGNYMRILQGWTGKEKFV